MESPTPLLASPGPEADTSDNDVAGLDAGGFPPGPGGGPGYAGAVFDREFTIAFFCTGEVIPALSNAFDVPA